jgi:hypothetical protein
MKTVASIEDIRAEMQRRIDTGSWGRGCAPDVPRRSPTGFFMMGLLTGLQTSPAQRRGVKASFSRLLRLFAKIMICRDSHHRSQSGISSAVGNRLSSLAWSLQARI